MGKDFSYQVQKLADTSLLVELFGGLDGYGEERSFYSKFPQWAKEGIENIIVDFTGVLYLNDFAPDIFVFGFEQFEKASGHKVQIVVPSTKIKNLIETLGFDIFCSMHINRNAAFRAIGIV